MIDFFGLGYDAAERLDRLPAIARIHHPVGRLAFLGGDGRDPFAPPYPSLRRLLFGDRHYYFIRGDLEHVLHDSLPGLTPIRFGASVQQIGIVGGTVDVTPSDGSLQRFDLVVGADRIRLARARARVRPSQRLHPPVRLAHTRVRHRRRRVANASATPSDADDAGASGRRLSAPTGSRRDVLHSPR